MKGTARILVVDDEASVREVLKHTLSADGYQALTAGDGYEALALLESQPVDLIVADINMPGMNGYQFHQCVAENPKWVTIPFLYLTAHCQDSDIRYGKELGVDDYLTKPFHTEDLLAAVRGRLRRARQLATASSQHQPRPILEAQIPSSGLLRIDCEQHRVWLNGNQVELSARELTLLQRLAWQPGSVVTLQELVQVTHELKTDHAEASNLLRPLIRSLRRKLGYSTGDLGCIESVRGVGYRLVAPRDP